MSEETINEEQVRAEHLAELNVPLHWAYLAAVPVGGLLLMLALIAWLPGAR